MHPARRHTDTPPRGEAPWIAIAILIAALLFICSPIAFLFLELR